MWPVSGQRSRSALHVFAWLLLAARASKFFHAFSWKKKATALMHGSISAMPPASATDPVIT